MLKPLLTGMGLLLFVAHVFAQGTEAERPGAVSRTPQTPYTSSYIADLSVRNEGYNNVVLSWVSVDSSNDYFVIERSCNMQPFEAVAVLHLGKRERNMEWRDESRRQGGVVYRLKVIFKDGSQAMAGLTSVIQSNGSADVKIYPNPAQDVLFIRLEFPSDITLYDGNGKPRSSLMNCSGLQIVNLHSLEKGVYVIRVYNRVLSTLSTERIIKN